MIRGQRKIRGIRDSVPPGRLLGTLSTTATSPVRPQPLTDDQVKEIVVYLAAEIVYSNAVSGLDSENVQDAIDELQELIVAGQAGLVHFGALIYLTNDVAGTTPGHGKLGWTAVNYDTGWDPGDGGLPQRFWLGADFTFITTDVNVTDNTITETGHGMVTGEGPVQFTTTTTLPAGISAATNYWIIKVDNNTFKIATSRANANSGSAVDITTQGTGTHTCDRGSYFVIPKGISYVEMRSEIRETGDLAGAFSVGLDKNDIGIATGFTGAFYQNMAATGTSSTSLVSGFLSVAEGDRFSVLPAGADAWTINGGTDSSWFSIRAIG